MLGASSKFVNAAYADVNKVVYEGVLYLGNYASASAYGASASASGSAANYPASGAIDGDRTEINVGPASGADNDVGQSSWRSTVAPDTTPQTLTVDFGTTRKISRIKLYHLTDHGLETYRFAYWDGSTWVDFAATDDIATGDETSIETTGELDVIDFPEISTNQIRLTVSGTATPADMANVVELEVYRAVNISDRIRSVRTSRGRDYSLANPIAAQATMEAINTDRFFSRDYSPTDAEVEAGFVNSELRPGLQVIVKAGLDLFEGEPELLTIFSGTLDSIKAVAGARRATLAATDGMKQLLRTKDSSKLKSAVSVDQAVRYVLNRANISDFEMTIDESTVELDYFFTDNEDHLSTIRDLVQAASDALFYFSTEGKAIFKVFNTGVGQDQVFTSQVDWETGSLSQIDTTSISGKIIYKYFSDSTWFNATSGWSSDGSTWSGSSSFTHDVSGLLLSCTGSSVGSPPAQRRAIARAQTDVVGAWDINFQENLAGLGFWTTQFYIMASNYVGSEVNDFGANHMFKDGYAVQITNVSPSNWSTCRLTIYRVDSAGAMTSLAVTGSLSRNAGTPRTLNIRRSAAGNINVFLDGSLVLSVVDATHTTGAYFGAIVLHSVALTQTNSLRLFEDGLGLPANNTGEGVWISPTVDMSEDVTALGTLDRTHVFNGGNVTYETRTSDDGLAWDAWTAIDTSTGQILSTLRRYLQVRITIFFSVDSSPDVSDITINWTEVEGSSKYPPAPSSHTFSFDGILRECELQLTDKMAGVSAILNDVTVQAQPIVLDGDNGDVKWQSLNGTPQEPISVSNPLNVTNGDVLTFPIVVSGGMDTSLMSGANPAAATVTFAGGATGSWAFSSIHPTRPVLVVTITASGNITDLKVTGKSFSNATYLRFSHAEDAESVHFNGRCQESVQNRWIGSANQAQAIAEKLVENFKDPVSYIPNFRLNPLFHTEESDRVTVVEENLGLNTDFIVANLNHQIDVPEGGGEATIETSGTLLRVPAGF